MIIDQELLTTFYLCHRKAYLLKDDLHKKGTLKFETYYNEVQLVAFANEIVDDQNGKLVIIERTSKSVRERHIIEAAFLSFILNLKGERMEVAIKFFKGLKIIKPRNELISMMINSMKETFQRESSPSPSFSYACKECPFYDECLKISSNMKDISLINGIGEKRKNTLLKAGFTDIESIANADPKLIASYTGIEFKEANIIVKQAMAISTSKSILIEKPDFPKSDHEYFFDVEKGEEELYLLGVFHEGKYHSFILDVDDWQNPWKKFLEFISEHRSPIYHYDRFDRDVIQKFADLSDMESKELVKRFVDLYAVVRRSLAMPVRFYSLKDVAGSFGFKWENPNFKGYDAMIALGEWKKTKDQSIMEEILKYNKDDCVALKILKEKLSDCNH